ncbi:uncharacterized protein LOC115720453 [Cannabis sativa]|uniref:uncharacterized protein LOC115720453 n=1 Tax=Cannabis sativa TaxID=3483 RepID=UPI0011E01B1C|nr:uncharacterized protein LOC115720453 [Cannabis sativa]
MAPSVNVTVDSPLPPLSKPPGSRGTHFSPPSSSSRRHVLFSDQTSNGTDLYSTTATNKRTSRKCRSCWLGCLAWSAMVTFAFVLVLLLFTIIAASFLNSLIPEISLHSIKFENMRAIHPSSPRRKPSIAADMVYVMRFTNNNEKTTVSFSSLTVVALWKGSKLGEAVIGAFTEKPKSRKELSLRTRVENGEKDDAYSFDAGLMTDENSVIDLLFEGVFGFKNGQFELKGVPMIVSCSLKHSDAMAHRSSLCSVRYCFHRKIVDN